MFKVESSAEAKDIGIWEITHIETGEVVAEIETFQGFRVNKKQLKVKDRVVCDVKNRKEAIVKLIEFFSENKKEIAELRNNHALLIHNLSVVEGYYTHNLILAEVSVVEEKIKQLEEYSLK